MQDTPEGTRIVVADAEPMWRLGVRQIVEMQGGMKIVAEVDSVAAARCYCETEQPEILIIDAGMQGGEAFYLVEELPRLCRRTRAIIFARQIDGLLVQRALRAGAFALLAKDDPVAALEMSLRRTVAGARHLGPAAEDALYERIARGTLELRGDDEAVFSERELQIYRLMAEGRSTRAVAATLIVSVKTIETHQARMKTKLGAKSSAELRQRAAAWAGGASKNNHAHDSGHPAEPILPLGGWYTVQ